jgi:hypothetical protein
MPAPIHNVADTVVNRLWALAKAKKLARIDIYIIRAACEIAAHYEAMDASEYQQLEDKTLRKLVEKVG